MVPGAKKCGGMTVFKAVIKRIFVSSNALTLASKIAILCLFVIADPLPKQIAPSLQSQLRIAFLIWP